MEGNPDYRRVKLADLITGLRQELTEAAESYRQLPDAEKAIVPPLRWKISYSKPKLWRRLREKLAASSQSGSFRVRPKDRSITRPPKR